jgi:myo-inositol 2-dehydrogenase / D-chiro-inositol 1-dehydrogenase
MRFGLLGAGRIGRIHGLNVAARGDATLVAIADTSLEVAAALAASCGAVVATAETILSDASIDAVLICTPTNTHAQMIEAAALAGKAVFCEKPVDLDATRIHRCLKIVEGTGKPLMIGFNRRFDPNFAALESRLRAGEAGAIEIVSVISRDPSPPPVDYVKHSGGLFRDMMIHDFDMARFILGEEPTEIFALGSALVDPAIGQADDIDTAAVLMKTASGKIAQISNSRRATYGYDQRIEVHGSKGMLRAGNIHETTIESATGGGFRTDPVQNFFLERYAAAYRAELDAFIAACRGHKEPVPSGQDGLKAQILADAATKSWRSGKPVAVSLTGI